MLWPPSRDVQHNLVLFIALLLQLSSAMYTAGPVVVALAAFSTYALLGHPLTAAVAFPSLALFNLLQFPIVMIPGEGRAAKVVSKVATCSVLALHCTSLCYAIASVCCVCFTEVAACVDCTMLQ